MKRVLIIVTGCLPYGTGIGILQVGGLGRSFAFSFEAFGSTLCFSLGTSFFDFGSIRGRE